MGNLTEINSYSEALIFKGSGHKELNITASMQFYLNAVAMQKSLLASVLPSFFLQADFQSHVLEFLIHKQQTSYYF